MVDIKEAGKKSGDKVVKDLVGAVTDVKPEVPAKIAA
jgi:V-type H+-transporting ATPase subunit G